MIEAGSDWVSKDVVCCKLIIDTEVDGNRERERGIANFELMLFPFQRKFL